MKPANERRRTYSRITGCTKLQQLRAGSHATRSECSYCCDTAHFHPRPTLLEPLVFLAAASHKQPENLKKKKNTSRLFPDICRISRHLPFPTFDSRSGTLLCGRSHAPCFSLLIKSCVFIVACLMPHRSENNLFLGCILCSHTQ